MPWGNEPRDVSSIVELVRASGRRCIAIEADLGVAQTPAELFDAVERDLGALDRITIAAAHELGHLGITANTINPGANDTGWMTDEQLASVAASTALRRVSQPGDVANLVSFLCSEAGGWITGQTLYSDGGASR